MMKRMADGTPRKPASAKTEDLRTIVKKPRNVSNHSGRMTNLLARLEVFRPTQRALEEHGLTWNDLETSFAQASPSFLASLLKGERPGIFDAMAAVRAEEKWPQLCTVAECSCDGHSCSADA